MSDEAPGDLRDPRAHEHDHAPDPYLWLEDVSGEAALAWVRERNAETVAELTTGPGFKTLEDEVREVLDDDGRIPYVVRRGRHLYNFWQDADRLRGIWRRTTLEEYRTEHPAWETVLDLDALAAAEGEPWAWAGSSVLAPGHRHALVMLSRDGADACVVREFDLETLRFVDGGFAVEEAKTRIGWIDHDHVWIGTDFGPGSMSPSGYPLQVRRWRRGTPSTPPRRSTRAAPPTSPPPAGATTRAASNATSSPARSTSGTRSCTSSPDTRTLRRRRSTYPTTPSPPSTASG